MIRMPQLAGRREGVDRAFEAIQRVRPAIRRDLERLVVVVTAGSQAAGRGITLGVP
jgi:hypothetical protein